MVNPVFTDLPIIRRRIEVVITRTTRNRLIRKGPWVRIPPSPPELYVASLQRRDYFSEIMLQYQNMTAAAKQLPSAESRGRFCKFVERSRIMRSKGTKSIADNRKARHDYFVLEEYEAGIELVGTEVKSIRQGGVNLKDSWCSIDNGEIFVRGMHISPYEKGNIFNRDPLRVRKLLMHKREISRLYGTVKQDGLSLIPLAIYFKDSKVKVKIGLCKGKKLYDKRADAAKRDAKREIDRGIKSRIQ